MSALEENNSGCPAIPAALLNFLEKQFPPISPAMDWPDRRIWLELGKRKVVEMLRAIFDQQQNR